MTRIFWETLRFLLPIPPVLLLLAWLKVLALGLASLSTLWFHAVVVPATTLGSALCMCLLVLALKWLLLGRPFPSPALCRLASPAIGRV